ncbi:flavodoxin family protein [Cytobacillus sp. NCCP-133]|uniref:flavodoxin family protein n=1 Tax=Cytobacillus sp. NCCP-133 TaxID=766848 RepID=UPI002230BA30|nr:flavodoxin family protein [Cytobacillus sp. NCCP-133]GLB59775.1 NAD(P)H-dependent oxidoreductase [Cytobacillus sp. NCCP-133]
MKVLALLGSTRENGNSEYLAKKIVKGTEHTLVKLSDLRIEHIVDQRHAEGGFSPVDDDYEQLVQHMLSHDVFLFATPLYWYGMSGPMKDFFDRWSQYLRDERFHLKEELARKKAYVVISGGSSAKVKGLPLVQQFQYIFDFVGMKFADYIIGSGVKPGEVKEDILALAKAEQWNGLFLK